MTVTVTVTVVHHRHDDHVQLYARGGRHWSATTSANAPDMTAAIDRGLPATDRISSEQSLVNAPLPGGEAYQRAEGLRFGMV